MFYVPMAYADEYDLCDENSLYASSDDGSWFYDLPGAVDVEEAHLVFDTKENAINYLDNRFGLLPGDPADQQEDNQSPYAMVILTRPDWNWFGTFDSRVYEDEMTKTELDSNRFPRLLRFAIARVTGIRKDLMRQTYDSLPAWQKGVPPVFAC